MQARLDDVRLRHGVSAGQVVDVLPAATAHARSGGVGSAIAQVRSSRGVSGRTDEGCSAVISMKCLYKPRRSPSNRDW